MQSVCRPGPLADTTTREAREKVTSTIAEKFDKLESISNNMQSCATGFDQFLQLTLVVSPRHKHRDSQSFCDEKLNKGKKVNQLPPE